MGAAPDADTTVYKAAETISRLFPTMLHKMREENVTIVSDSWGLCELFVPVKITDG